MNTILDNNMLLLKKYNSHVYEKLLKYIEGAYLPKNNEINRIALAKNDDFIINMQVTSSQGDFLIVEHEDPIGQAYLWIDKFIDPSNKAEIVFGMGFGYHLEVLLESFKNKKVIVIEPNIELFYQILKIRNLEAIIKAAILLIDEDINVILRSIYSLYWDTSEGGISCQPFEVYSEMFPGFWEELRNKFIKQAQSFSADISTRRNSGSIWINNYIKNLKRINNAADASGLAGNFAGKPGILVSAGPSLDKNIHLLKDLKDKCVILAAGTAVEILQQKGITPHFMVGIDAWEAEAEMHKKIISNEIFFIYSNQVAIESVKSYNGPKFLLNYNVDTYTESFFKYADIDTVSFMSGPSVSNTTFDILYKMGCNPIIIIGQDLAYTDGNLYAGKLEQNEVIDSKKDNSKFTQIKDIYGNNVYTTLSLLAIKNFFEGYFEKVKDKVEIINATEGGLNIEYSRNDTLQNLIDTYNFKSYDIRGKVEAIHKGSSFPEKVERKLKEYNNKILIEIDILSEYSKQQLKLVDLINRDFYHPTKNKNAFDKIVKNVADFTDKIIKSPIYNSILRNLLETEFYLIKMELDRAIKELSDYSVIKKFYIEAITRQNELLNQKLKYVKNLFLENE